MNKTLWIGQLMLLLAMAHALPAAGEEHEFRFGDLSADTYLDFWMYPFNVTPGSRIQAPTFGAVGSEGFDERDGQMILAVDTEALGIPAGRPQQDYRIVSAQLVLTETFGGYTYDPTYDSYTTHLDPSFAGATDDLDDGRPIELFGVGLRNGYTEFGFPDGANTKAPVYSSASGFGPIGRSTRDVFIADSQGRDVSNNIDSLAGGVGGFEVEPFSVARLMVDGEELEAGEEVPARAEWTFDIRVDDAGVQDYFARGLAAGQLGLGVSSLHDSGLQGINEPFPNPATANHFAYAGPVLRIEVEMVEGIMGDFDGDGSLTPADIDILSDAIRAGDQNLQLDVLSDGTVDAADRQHWVRQLAGTEFGDADLNGSVGFPDFLALSSSFGTANGWAGGDFDGDGNVQFGDFLLLADNFGFPAAAEASSVPEPSAGGLMTLAVAACLTRRRSRRRSSE